MLVWRIYIDSLPSKVCLLRRKVFSKDQNLSCVLCGSAQESSDHLLIHCAWSWRVWTDGLRWWGTNWVAPGTAQMLLESWELSGSSKTSKRLWKILCYAILWSIWEERNRRCFQNRKRSEEEVGELVKARVAWWAKYRRMKCPYSLDAIKGNIEDVREN
ncbi:hypothetical protein QQ045_003156 [Rhodiola kirilowii]